MTGSLDHLWAGWRSAYIESVVDDRTDADADGAVEVPPTDGSLFERILALPDDEGYVVHRGDRCSVVLNAYPYTCGHVLVLPDRAVAELDELDPAIYDELWRLVRDAVTAIRVAYRCDGVNIGANLGGAAGAGVPDHLHVHCLPRWNGDTNFMTAIADTRVMPEPLAFTWRKLRDAWPVPGIASGRP
jgi:diadenosine tetraphosphate (Ap4A) HIT family hydrolase